MQTTNHKTYIATTYCARNHKNNISLTLLEVAFDLFDKNKLWDTPCTICGGKIESMSKSDFEITDELFNIWANNPDYQFSEGFDEDLDLAEMKYLPMLLRAIDDKNFPNSKKAVVVGALCALWYNNYEFPKSDYDTLELRQMRENSEILKPILLERKGIILYYKDLMWDYIWEVVEKLL
ncbi:hypothetical protein LU290_07545 [Moraxella nasibovis]|uniref:hypothetical protein n=1 Tax=Moraxella nasibovis TaxID=2904120 RepID=UPI00240F046E|nr:hypothetical protein [Moraxella nasibovis]WFF38108.1 hypothetical protein LU290_07545 [Moraxella nasibovis]